MPHHRNPRRGNLISALLCAAILVSVTGPVAAAADQDVRPSSLTPTRTAPTPGTPVPALLPAPAGEAFFTPPNPLPGRPGDVIWAAPAADPALAIHGAFNPGARLWPIRDQLGERLPEVWQILYHTLDRQGVPRAGLGIAVFDPFRQANAPVIVATHGWVGLGNSCDMFHSPMRGTLAGLPFLMGNYVSRGYVVMVASHPGLSTPGLATPLITEDGARSLIDAGHAVQLLTGAGNRVLYHGHSLGGLMALNVGGEVATYAPSTNVVGLVSSAGPGITDPNSPLLSMESVAGNANMRGALLASALMLEASYGPKRADLRKYLTPAGLKITRQIGNLCGPQIAQKVILLTDRDLFRPNIAELFRLNSGTLSRSSHIPVYIATATYDGIADPLRHHHAQQSLCGRGQPVFRGSYPADHGGILGMSLGDTAGLKGWIVDALENGGPVGGCTESTPELQRGYTYTAEYLARNLSVAIAKNAKITMRATGSCAAKGNRLTIRGAGTCALTVTVAPARGPAVSRTVSVLTR